MNTFEPSPQWCLEDLGEQIQFNAGADLIYVINDLDQVTSAELIRIWQNGAVDPRSITSSRVRGIVSELITAGVLMPTVVTNEPYTVTLQWCGDQGEAISAEIRRLWSPSWIEPAQSGTGTPDVVVVIRTNGSLQALSEIHPASPHFLVDLSFHHTISLGPLVYPGDTACFRCLATSTELRWGAPQPPALPRATTFPALGAALAVAEIEAARQGRSRLINRTVAYNIDAHEVIESVVLRRPGCSRCDDTAVEVTGRIDALQAVPVTPGSA